jgi:hypothetical protein
MVLGDVVIQGAELASSQLLADSVESIRGRLAMRIDDHDPSWARLTSSDLSAAVQRKCEEFAVCPGSSHKRPIAGGHTAALRLPFRHLTSIVWFADHFFDDCLIALVLNNPNLSAVQLDGGIEKIAEVTAALTERKNTLRNLDFGYNGVTDEELQVIADSCKLLTAFSVLVYEVDQVTIAGFNAILTGCPLLEYIYVEYDYYTDRTPALLTSACTHGKNLWAIHMPDSELCNEALQARRSSAVPLRELCCSWGHGPLDFTGLSGNVLSAVSKLSITALVDRNISTFRAALRTMPLLNELELGQNFQGDLPVTVLDAVARSCTGLTKLYICAQEIGDADSALANIASRNPALAVLDVRTWYAATDAVILALAANCPKLLRLQLRSAEYITDAAVLALAKGCPALTHISLVDNDQITAECALQLAKHCRSLRELQVKALAKLTYGRVLAFERDFPKLSVVQSPTATAMTINSTRHSSASTEW